MSPEGGGWEKQRYIFTSKTRTCLHRATDTLPASGVPRTAAHARRRSSLGGPQRPKIHQCGISRNCLTLKSSHIPAVSAVVAADWLRLDGGMET